MPRTKRTARGRSDIAGTVDRLQHEYKEKTEALTDTKEDVSIERDTIDGMEMDGTIEGVEAVKDSLRQAEDTSKKEFTEQADALTESLTEGTEFETEIQERSDATAADMEKVGEARSELHSGAAGASAERAESQLQEDREFLRGEDQRERESREAAAQECQQLTQIVFGAGG